MTIDDLKLVLLNNNLTELSEATSKANIAEQDKFGNNILHYYLKHVGSLQYKPADIIRLFKTKGLNLDARQEKGQFGYAPLHLAILYNQAEVFNILLQEKVNPDIQDKNGNTPLSSAVFNYLKDTASHQYFIEVLLKAGANPGLMNNHGVSAKSLAESIGNADVGKFF